MTGGRLTIEQLRELNEDQRAAAVVALAEEIAQRVGLSWEAIVARHRPPPDTDTDTDWEEMPAIDDDAPWAAHFPWLRRYPGYRRRYRGKLLIVRERGPAGGLPGGWYAIADGELLAGSQGQTFFRSEDEAICAAEAVADEMTLEDA